jgi:hypothetical protein
MLELGESCYVLRMLTRPNSLLRAEGGIWPEH